MTSRCVKCQSEGRVDCPHWASMHPDDRQACQPVSAAPAEPLTGHRSDCAKHGDDEHDSTPWKECDCGADGPTKEWYRKRCDWYSGELDRLRAQLATQQAALLDMRREMQKIIEAIKGGSYYAEVAPSFADVERWARLLGAEPGDGQ